MTQPLEDLSVAELLEAYRRGQFDPVDAVNAMLGRIDEFDDRLHSVITLRRRAALDEARQSAARWQTGKTRPLEGVPVGVKDMIDVVGVPTTGGSQSLVGNFPREDAEVVRRLREAGAIVIAKLATSPFAFADPYTEDFPTTRNPWNLDRFTGGTSTGPAAALAAHMLPLAFGTDSAGSVRIPAAHCGVTGMKPTFGAISRFGVLPSTWSLDSVGIMARTAHDIALALRVVIGADRRDPAAQGHASLAEGNLEHGAAGLRIGVLRGHFTEMCTPACLARYDHALSELKEAGAELFEAELSMMDMTEHIAWPILASELASTHQALQGQPVRYGNALRAFIEYGRTVPAIDYLRCQRLRVVFQRAMRASMQAFDVMVSPTTQTVAPAIDRLLCPTNRGETPWFDVAAKNTLPFSLSGMPAISVPIGRADLNLPFGLQIAATHTADAKALRVAAALQQRSAYHGQMPPLLTAR